MAAAGRQTSEAAADLKEKVDLEEKIRSKTEMITQLKKSVFLKEERLKETQVCENERRRPFSTHLCVRSRV